MSSRLGNVITGTWLLDEAKKKAWEKIQETTKSDIQGSNVYYSDDANVKPSKQDSTAETVGNGSCKYALLKNNVGGDIKFDFDESVSLKATLDLIFNIHMYDAKVFWRKLDYRILIN